MSCVRALERAGATGLSNAAPRVWDSRRITCIPAQAPDSARSPQSIAPSSRPGMAARKCFERMHCPHCVRNDRASDGRSGWSSRARLLPGNFRDARIGRFALRLAFQRTDNHLRATLTTISPIHQARSLRGLWPARRRTAPHRGGVSPAALTTAADAVGSHRVVRQKAAELLPRLSVRNDVRRSRLGRCVRLRLAGRARKRVQPASHRSSVFHGTFSTWPHGRFAAGKHSIAISSRLGGRRAEVSRADRRLGLEYASCTPRAA
jgi:hypothetical protein